MARRSPESSSDPLDENRIFVAVLGHPYGPNPETRRVQVTNGGSRHSSECFTRMKTPAPPRWDSIRSIRRSSTLPCGQDDRAVGEFVVEWSAQGLSNQSTKDNVASADERSADDRAGIGRIGFTIAPSDSRRLYATVDAPTLGGIYRSDDGGAGETWRRTNSDGAWVGVARPTSRGEGGSPKCGRRLLGEHTTHRSTDGGVTFLPSKRPG